MNIRFKRENQNYNYFNILLYITILYLTSIPVYFWKIAPINIAMVILQNILEMHCLNRDGTKWRIFFFLWAHPPLSPTPFFK